MWQRWFNKNNYAQSEPDTAGLVIDPVKIPAHVAIIMDGNGRWAKAKGMPRVFGHRAGVETLREIVKTASQIGVKVLTAYAFSTENWKRPADEVAFLMNLLAEYLDSEIEELNQNQVKLRFIGDTEQLAPALKAKIAETTRLTAQNSGLILNLAVNYGGRAELVRAFRLMADKISNGALTAAEITEDVVNAHLYTADLPDPDLLIRPSGDLRLSNYLLWQVAYTEFWFTNVNWPDFKPHHFIEAIYEYQQRERRFGGLKK
ncbi:MAG: isoprenyl transferase [Negativicutes bacterium]|nr:isoprenyl transferase [Negativicutes bacterium]